MKPSRDMESVVPKARPYTSEAAVHAMGKEWRKVTAAAAAVKAAAAEEVKAAEAAMQAAADEWSEVMAGANVEADAAEEWRRVAEEEWTKHEEAWRKVSELGWVAKAQEVRAELIKTEGTAVPRRARFSLKKHLPGWPRFWELFGFLLPRKTREKVYDEIRNELLEDYYYTRKKYRTKWARRWLTLCFTFRTFLVIGDCWRVLLGAGVAKALLGLLLFWRIK